MVKGVLSLHIDDKNSSFKNINEHSTQIISTRTFMDSFKDDQEPITCLANSVNLTQSMFVN